MITVFTIISLLLHVAVPLVMWLWFSNQIDDLKIRIEKLEPRQLPPLTVPASLPAKYTPAWRRLAGLDRQSPNATGL